MAVKRHKRVYEAERPFPRHRQVRVPPDSELPAVAPPPVAAEVTPHVCEAGGVANIPEETLSPSEQASDVLDHAGLDVELPEEDRAR
jgi:hypothetical protein